MKRSKFSLSHYHLTTCDMGQLIPLTWFEVIPGDTIQQRTSLLIRVSPMLAPVMHPVRVRVHHWYVPYNLIWDDFEDFITGGEDGDDSTIPPRLNYTNQTVVEGGLADHLGIPPDDYTGVTLLPSALPMRAYSKIWNEWYRDQNLSTELTIDTGNGTDSSSTLRGYSADVKDVCWEKDYFTAARPWEQLGTQLFVPIGEEAPITGIGTTSQTFGTSSVGVYETDGSNPTYANAQRTTDAQLHVEGTAASSGYPNIYADLSNATGVSINELRLALGIQRFQEARAKYGADYVEYLRYNGVKGLDQRLKKPEYLGGGRSVIQFSEVLAHDGSNTGDLYGHGIGLMRSNRYRRFFPEHGLVMTMLSVVPKAIYTQALHRSFSKTVKEDYFQKELQRIGEQEILNQEVYAVHSSADETFGYQSRYDEYRSLPSRISGEFHSTLNHWHLARQFGSDPSLNATFVECVPTKRVLASEETDGLYIMANHNIQARRPVDKFARAITL